ncbi:MAG: MarR family transcriptional regulator [Hyphomicrobiales bacterium]
MDKTSATLTALSRILRATELHDREVAASVGLTTAQLRLLKFIKDTESANAKTLASRVHVSQATITVLLDKLEVKQMIERRVSSMDRRQKLIHTTEIGRDVLDAAPDPMQRAFVQRLQKLEDWEQAMLMTAVERIAHLMDADEIDAAPGFVAGEFAGIADCP